MLQYTYTSQSAHHLHFECNRQIFTEKANEYIFHWKWCILFGPADFWDVKVLCKAVQVPVEVLNPLLVCL